MTRKIFVALLMVASLAAAPAQGEEFTCQEITDPDIQFQAELCSAHVGCKLVMGIHSACTKVKTFLNKLKNLSFGKKTIDSSDVFDAAAPSTEGDETFNKISNSIKASYDKQPQKQVVIREFPDGEKRIYEGPMTNGERNGTGVLITSSGTAFRGDFVNGRQAGMGESFNEKSHKAGGMNDELIDGFGVGREAAGGRFEGSFRRGRRNGQGTNKFPNGNEYTGNWEDDQIHGQGTYKFPNGDEYTGNFYGNKRHGQGTFKWVNGNEYTGNWFDGKRQGQGTNKYASGDQYTGNFYGDKQQGQGTYKWADGTRFEGEWRDGKQFSGTEIGPNGTRVEFANGAVVKSPQQAAAAPPPPPAAQSSAETPASSGSLAQACKAEQQRILTVLPSRTPIHDHYGDLNNMLQVIPYNMTDFANYVFCDYSKQNGERPICEAFRENKNGKHPFSKTSQTYADALMFMADNYTYKAKTLGDPPTREHYEKAEMLLLACVARHEANRIKAAAVSPTQPDSGRMRADESDSVNGRLRTADKPLFTCCNAQTTREHINDFNHDWDNREETLYQLGEKMLEPGDFKLQTIAGRAAFLQACDEKIAAARARARSK